ncbi:MFS transporter [Caballeronia sp. LZ035]|uniref:MFS transporter n=1 Tax=Caballeronia sp. LZ035 TaxID=3038568 RepID=UPI002856298E|nr:MFS transporter [Caballeronia sp. LZ035]MDR5760551.1 MFS transporter [Caballeronia sp. LZ035]
METEAGSTAGQNFLKPQDEVDTSIYRKVAWRLVPLLFVCYIVSYLDRINIGVAKLQMAGDLKFSNAIYAFGASIFFWGYVVFEVPSNLLLQRIGARVWIARIMITWGFFSAAVAFVEPIAHALGIAPATAFYILRFLLGACEAGFFPGVVLYLSYWYSPRRQSEVIAGFLLALPLATVLGAPFSGWILEVFNGTLAYKGWQWMFVIEGVPAMILGFVVLAFLSDIPERVDWLSTSEKQHIRMQVTNRVAEERHRFRDAIVDVRIWIMCAIYILYGTGFYGLAFWLPTIIHASGVESTLRVGLLTAIPYAVSAIYMLWHATHARKTGERRFHTGLPVLVGGIALVLSAFFSSNLVVSLVFISIAVSGLIAVMTVFWTLPAGFLSGTAAAAGIAIVSSIGSLSGILGSFVSSVALDITGTMKSGTYVMGVLMVLSGLIALAAPRSLYGAARTDSALSAETSARAERRTV